MSLVWAGFAAFAATSLFVGVRLLVLAARTRERPELLIGVAVLGIGPVGFGLQTLAGATPGAALAEPLAAAGAIAVAVGLWAKLGFNWLVYRRDSPAALAAMLTLAGLIAAHLVAQPLLGSFLEATRDVGLAAQRGAIQSIALFWGAAEALAYWTQLRRRARLGLADPVLVNRFLMWAISAAAAGLGTALGVAASLATGKGPLELPAVLVSSSAHGLVAALGMWLAFAPPSAYRMWLAGARSAA
jgi:hypothetical protein